MTNSQDTGWRELGLYFKYISTHDRGPASEDDRKPKEDKVHKFFYCWTSFLYNLTKRSTMYSEKVWQG